MPRKHPTVKNPSFARRSAGLIKAEPPPLDGSKPREVLQRFQSSLERFGKHLVDNRIPLEIRNELYSAFCDAVSAANEWCGLEIAHQKEHGKLLADVANDLLPAAKKFFNLRRGPQHKKMYPTRGTEQSNLS
jgi:hypothetical protein